jgi:LacI family transcriptional regulator
MDAVLGSALPDEGGFMPVMNGRDAGGLRKPAARGRVTLQAIADHLVVSTATVSLALRDSPLVADTTKFRVQKIAREMGYSYNRSAASLRTARTHILAVAFHDVTNPYFAELLAAIEEKAMASGLSILLGTYCEDIERQDRVLGTLREYRPDGMILSAAGGTTVERLGDIVSAGIPVIQLSREIDGSGFDFVGSDDRLGVRLGMRHLLDLGHRRIAMLGGVDQISTGRLRHQGYREALAEAGLPFDPELVFHGFGTRETGLLGVRQVLSVANPPTAAMCFNDLTAFGAMLGLRHLGKEAGRDFSLVGCDDVKEAAQWYPALTTLHNHQDEMGRSAAALLLRRLADPHAPQKRIVLRPTLQVRGTTVRIGS